MSLVDELVLEGVHVCSICSHTKQGLYPTHIGETKVSLSGHQVFAAGIEVDPEKVQALLALSPPSTIRELTSFIQKVRYMGRFLYLLSELIAPLQRLSNAQTLAWDSESNECFEEVKRELSTLPIMMPPKWDESFYVCPSVGE